MGKIKKVIACVVAAGLVAGAGYKGASYIRKSNEEVVLVVPVGSLASDYYMQDTYLDGTVTTNVSQSITVDADMIISEVPVSEGDSVSKGDVLINFDMTLVEMELNIARLKGQQLEQQLAKAEARLKSLKNGGPIVETANDPLAGDSLDDTMDDLSSMDMDNDEASAALMTGGKYLAMAMNPVLLAAAMGDFFTDSAEESGAPVMQAEIPEDDMIDETDSGSEEITEDNMDVETDNAPSSPFDAGETFISGENDPPEVTPVPEGNMNYFDIVTDDQLSEFSDSTPIFYDRLDGESMPFTGRGSQEEPYVFLCSSATGVITANGEFLNKMAGFSEDGTRVLSQKGYWYQIEFHERDTIADFENRKASCIGYYLVDGSLLEIPVNSLAEIEFTLDGALQYVEETPEVPDDTSGGGSVVNTPTITREEAIKQKEREIANLKLDIQESDIEIGKLEKKVEKKTIYSKIDGIVSHVGDSLTGNSSGNVFMTIKSKDGYYIRGSVSELMLDQVKEGTILQCESYEKGRFDAEVVDVSDYPVSSSGGYFYGEGNPNVSYYTYSAEVMDSSIKLTDQDWLTVTVKNETDQGESIVLGKEFVITENGISYVYKDDNGVLKKQIVQSGGNVNSGYSVLIKGGITREDKIAFPYSSSAKSGVKTREGTLEELYGY